MHPPKYFKVSFSIICDYSFRIDDIAVFISDLSWMFPKNRILFLGIHGGARGLFVQDNSYHNY